MYCKKILREGRFLEVTWLVTLLIFDFFSTLLTPLIRGGGGDARAHKPGPKLAKTRKSGSKRRKSETALLDENPQPLSVIFNYFPTSSLGPLSYFGVQNMTKGPWGRG